jgi:hypothetical protein
MKLRIDFDAADFESMLLDFFNQAGYAIAPASLDAARAVFVEGFAGSLSLEVTPIAKEPAPQPQLPVVEDDEPPTPPVVQEDVILPFGKVMDPEYAEVTEINSLLNLSRQIVSEKK